DCSTSTPTCSRAAGRSIRRWHGRWPRARAGSSAATTHSPPPASPGRDPRTGGRPGRPMSLRSGPTAPQCGPCGWPGRDRTSEPPWSPSRSPLSATFSRREPTRGATGTSRRAIALTTVMITTRYIDSGDEITLRRPQGRPTVRSTPRQTPRPGYGRTTAPNRAGEEGSTMISLRREIGDVLREARQRQGRTLREVSSAARVSLGYLSEVERGQKEASSELLASICEALNIPLSFVLRAVSDRVAVIEGVHVPDTVPDELLRREPDLLTPVG